MAHFATGKIEHIGGSTARDSCRTYVHASAGRFFVLVILSVLMVVTGCAGGQSTAHSLRTPPLVLTPVSKANVEDGRGRFREIYCAVREDHGKTLPYDRPCEEVLLRLQAESSPTGKPVNLGKPSLDIEIIIIPGVFSECIARFSQTYSDALAHLQKLGYRARLAQVSGRSSSSYNGTQVRDAVKTDNDELRKQVVLIGYSKGTADILEALVSYPELSQSVRAVVSVAGVVNGSPMADAFSEPYERLLKELPLSACPPGDGGAIESLRRSNRLSWLENHQLPSNVRYYSLVAFNEPEGISRVLLPGYRNLAKIDPRNDGQVIFYDAVIPGSTLLGYVKADHWAVAMPFSRDLPILATTVIDHNEFPREALLETIVRFVEERLSD